ncbi:MAG TPA: DNA-binding protein [Geobacteraceae bacterium]
MAMKRLILFAVALVLAVPVTSRGEEAKQPAAALPKGHPAIPPPKESASIPGKVLKTMDSGGYTYMFLQVQGGKKIWVAVPKTKVRVGQKIAFVPGPEMKNFKSKTMNRTFDTIIFSLGLAGQKGSDAGKKNKKKEAAVVVPGSKSAAVAAEKIKVAKATGPDAHTVAEVFALKNVLNGKKVVVRGKVVKVAEHIMKMNWVHIQDGTGTPGKNDHDLVVTTTALPAEGDTVTVSGTLLKDKDYGSGYKYDALVENAEIVK